MPPKRPRRRWVQPPACSGQRSAEGYRRPLTSAPTMVPSAEGDERSVPTRESALRYLPASTLSRLLSDEWTVAPALPSAKDQMP